jgi:hypothetical protein
MQLTMRKQGGVYLRGDTFWIRYSHKGVKIRESAETADQAVATRKLKSRLDDLAVYRKGFQKFTTPDMRKSLVHDLLEALKADFTRRGKCLNQARSALKIAAESFGHLRASELSPKTINAYIDRQLAAGYMCGCDFDAISKVITSQPRQEDSSHNHRWHVVPGGWRRCDDREKYEWIGPDQPPTANGISRSTYMQMHGLGRFRN